MHIRLSTIRALKVLGFLAILGAQIVLGTTTACAESKKPETSELLKDNTFADNSFWLFRGASVVDSNPAIAGKMVELSPATAKEDSYSFSGFRLYRIPVDHKLHFTCRLQGEFAGQKININTFAYNNAGKLVAAGTNQFMPPRKAWQEVSVDFVAPTGTSYITLWVINKTKHTAYFAKPSFTVGVFERAKITASSSYPQNSNPTDTKILLAKVTTAVRSSLGSPTGVVTFPIPSVYKEQIPLTFEIKTEPVEALVGYKIHKRDDNLNYVCEATIKPPLEGAKVFWQSLVLVCGSEPLKLPKSQASAPPETKQWTRSTPCAQSEDPEIRAKAEELAAGKSDIESYVRSVIKFTAKNKGKGEKFVALDAKSAMSCGGSCTSRANLGAALLRARGIPARTMSHLPAWYTGKMFEHWLTEYWHPGVGWIPLETTLGAFQAPCNTFVVLAISSTADEDKAADPVHLRVIMPGAAYLSGNEISSNLYPAALTGTDGVNTAEVLGVIKGTPAEMLELKKAAQTSLVRAYGADANQFAAKHDALIRRAAEKWSAIELIGALEK